MCWKYYSACCPMNGFKVISCYCSNLSKENVRRDKQLRNSKGELEGETVKDGLVRKVERKLEEWLMEARGRINVSKTEQGPVGHRTVKCPLRWAVEGPSMPSEQVCGVDRRNPNRMRWRINWGWESSVKQCGQIFQEFQVWRKGERAM